MADINKNDNWQNRKSHGGKGDFYANDMRPYRAGSLWGVSDCCGSPVAKLNGRITCEKCLKVCNKVKKREEDICWCWENGLCCNSKRRSFIPKSKTDPCVKDDCPFFSVEPPKLTSNQEPTKQKKRCARWKGGVCFSSVRHSDIPVNRLGQCFEDDGCECFVP